MNYYKIVLHIQQDKYEILTSFLFEVGCLGIETKDKDIPKQDLYGEIYTLNPKDYPEEGVIIIGYFDHIKNIDVIKQFIQTNQITLLEEISVDIVEDNNDESEYQKHFQEIELNQDISIIPPWMKPSDAKKTYVYIEPGLGFGTGQHPTTQLAINHLLTYSKTSDTMLDFGSGSGIIAIIAKKIGLKKVYGIDLDMIALKNATSNALLNDVEIEFSCEGIDTFKHQAHIIVGNIVYPILRDNLNELYKHLKPNGILILSGILPKEKEKMLTHLRDNQFKTVDIKEKEQWVSIVSRKED